MKLDLKELVQKDSKWRQAYHLMPEKGWLNDPNGTCQFQGTYHVYHQYEPTSAKGGATHWGHKTSTDLIHFKEEPIFMSPDQTFDRDGVYSGSAIEVDGQLNFFYTGNVKKEGFYDYVYSGRQQNVVRVISADGFQIKERRVVIDHDDFPSGYSDHIRDPKVWWQGDRYYMILGGRTRDNRGAILLFESQDLDNWAFVGDLLRGNEDQGFMWECPDLFTQAGQTVLIFSPQGVIGSPTHYQNQYSAGYLLGELNWTDKIFQPTSEFEELDYGFDFYAPQSFTDESGRQIMWAWMGVPDHEPDYVNPTVSYGWQHCLTIPRQLVVKENHLYQVPLEEYQALRQELVEEKGKEIQLQGEVYELAIKGQDIEQIELFLRQDSQIHYDKEEGLFSLRHGSSGFGRRKRLLELSQLDSLQIFSDYSSLEIFVNGGEYALTSRIYPDQHADTIQIKSDQELEVKLWSLAK
ncbi:glycoside hydrolase family 32 protein [Hutsoniella sourekii]|uniref:glycoside hydrolase family 32 protein n=1 Tax=Hutsoniella sourekii TaxID=87650 RepID=UPI000482FAF5|nr:glycoside hydrolase family 32 protein [Hutsoniella sourekii]